MISRLPVSVDGFSGSSVNRLSWSPRMRPAASLFRLVPSTNSGTAIPSPFEAICEDFRRCAFAFAEDSFYVYVFNREAEKAPKDARLTAKSDCHILGTGRLIASEEVVAFAAMSWDNRKSQVERFSELSDKAGKHIPAPTLNQLPFSELSSPAARWLAAMWLGRPPVEGVWFDLGQKTESIGEWGWTWREPFYEAILAAETLGLAESPMNRESEWSLPFSKAEIASRLLGRKSRARDLEAFGKMVEIQETTDHKWIVRLDTLPPNYRDKLKPE